MTGSFISQAVRGCAMAAVVLCAAPALAQQFQDQTAARFPLPLANEYTNQVATGDIDNDNDLDIIFANGGGFMSAQPPLLGRIYINDGTGVFSDQSIARGAISGIFRGAELGDIDGDGDLDVLFAADFATNSRMLLNNGSGFFTDVTAARLPNITMGSSRGQFADVDNDGDLDIYLVDGITSRFGTGQGKLYLNNGSGFYTNATGTNMPVDTASQPMDCIFGDIENDFDLDLHVAARGGNNKLYRNNGSGVFVSLAIQQGGTPYSYDFGDMDNDGDLDLLGANGGSGNQEVLLRNNGNATFTNVTGAQFTPNPGADDNDSKFFDYDNDGDLDCIIGALGQGAEKIYNNNGTGTFTQVVNGPPPGVIITPISDSSMDIKVADFNNDGRIDILTAQGESGSFIDRLYINVSGPVDNRAPRVIKTEQVPAGTKARQDRVVRVIVYDDYTSDRGFDDKGIELHYTTSASVAGGEQIVDMKWVGNSVWRGVIPGQPCGTTVSYFVRARDWNNNVGNGLTLNYTVSEGCGSPADFNNDGFVNGVDLGILLAAWGVPGCGGAKSCPQDLNGDGGVGGIDLGILLAAWTL